MSDWGQDFSNESITDDNREAFNTFADRYNSPEAAIVGGFNAQKAMGAAFKMPVSMESLSDDAMRSDFTSKANHLLGREFAKDASDFEGVDFKAGLAEDAALDDNFLGLVKNWAVESGISKSDVGKMIAFNNGPMREFILKAQTEQKEADFEATAKKVSDELAADPDFGNIEEVEKQSDLFERALRNHCNLSPDQVEEVVKAFVGAGLTQNATTAKLLLKTFAPMAAEGITDGGEGAVGGEGGKQQTPYEFKKALHPASDSLWGSTSDTWENQTIGMRQRAGIKS